MAMLLKIQHLLGDWFYKIGDPEDYFTSSQIRSRFDCDLSSVKNFNRFRIFIYVRAKMVAPSIDVFSSALGMLLQGKCQQPLVLAFFTRESLCLCR